MKDPEALTDLCVVLGAFAFIVAMAVATACAAPRCLVHAGRMVRHDASRCVAP